MIFQNPKWLFGIVAVVVFFIVSIWILSQRKKDLARAIDPSLWGKIIPEWDPSLVFRKLLFWSLAAVFACMAMARPQWGMKEETVRTTGIDIMVLMDVSRSMLVEDEVPSRLKKGKHLVKSLLERLRGDRVGLIAFAGSAFIASPLTTDLSYVGETLDVLDPQMIVNQGTDLALAIETAHKAMDRGAESTQASKAIILVSDGENHSNRDLKIAQQLPESGIKLYVIGVGTEKGGPVPVRDESGRLVGYKRDSKGQTVVSVFQADSLKKIASTASGVFLKATSSENEIDDIARDLGTLSPDGMSERKIVTYHERFQIFLAISIIFLLIELSLPAFRKKKFLSMGVWAFVLFFASSAEAASVGAYLESEKGIKAYQNGEYEEAVRHFEAAQEKESKNPLTEFNQGTALSRQGNPDAAIQSFSSAAEKAKETQNEALAGRSFFNQGNSWVKKGDTNAALRSYLQAIESAQKSKDIELEKMARNNIEVLHQKKQQEQQKKKDNPEKSENQEKNDSQKKEQEKQGQEKKDSQSGQKEQQQPQESKNETKEGTDQRKQQKQEFKSETLTKEDADRVMQELSSQQKELQTRLKKQKGQPMNKEKDW